MSIKKNMIIRRKNNPFFSIITVVKNDEKYILKTISSIIKKASFSKKELEK